MLLTDGISRRQGVIGQLVIGSYGAYQRSRCLPVGKLFSQECMEHCAGSIQGLQFILNIQCIENIHGIVHRQMGGIRIIRGISGLSGRLDAGPALSVVLCQTVRGTLRRGRLQIVEVSVLLLIIRQTLSHMIQYFLGELLGPGIAHIRSQPVGI